MEGKTARGASSPAKPALHMPEPLSTTSAAISSSMANYRHKRGPRLPRSHQTQPPLPCPLPARRGLEPPGGARPNSGDKGSPGRPRYYHKRQTLVRRRPHGKPGLRPSPHRRRPRLRPVGGPLERAGGDHTQQEARASTPILLRPRPFRITAPPSPSPGWPRSKSQYARPSLTWKGGKRKGSLPSVHAPQYPET